MLGGERKKCPVCESINVRISRPSLVTKLIESFWPFKGESKNLNLCADCNFSWED